MKSDVNNGKVRIQKLGIISLKVDALSQQHHSLHNKLLNDSKPYLMDKLSQIKYQIENLVSELQILYDQNSNDQRANYIQLLIIKLKKSVNNQPQMNSILNKNNTNASSKITNLQFQSQFQKLIKKSDQKRLKNMINQAYIINKNQSISPIKKINFYQSSRYSPFQNKQILDKNKVKIVINKLDKKQQPLKIQKHNAINRNKIISKTNKIQQKKLTKKPYNNSFFENKQEFDNTQKLQNLMLTIRMTKQQYFQYMRDD